MVKQNIGRADGRSILHGIRFDAALRKTVQHYAIAHDLPFPDALETLVRLGLEVVDPVAKANPNA